MKSDDSGTDGQPDRPKERAVPTDPYLVIVRVIKRLLAGLNRSYAYLETLPGWARVGFGASVFLLSIYYGRPIKNVIDGATSRFVTPVLGDLVQIPFGIQVVLFLLVLVSVQALFINLRLDALREQVEEGFNVIENEVDRHMETTGDVAPDGGERVAGDASSEPTDSSGAGALSGAAAGAALGAPFGPGAVLGGAIMGAIVGDEVEKSSIRNREQRKIEAAIVHKLLARRVFNTDPIPPDTLYHWFGGPERDDVEPVLNEIVEDPSAPVAETDAGEIYLTDFEDAVAYRRSRRIR